MNRRIWRRRAATLTWVDFADGTVILDLDSGRYHRLNRVGQLVWARLEPGASAEALVDELLARFAAPREVITQDVEGLLARLDAQGLLQAEVSPSSSTS